VLRDIARRARPGARLVAAGCMVERFRDELEDAVPEVRVFVGTRELLSIRGALAGDAPARTPDSGPRLVTTPSHVAYLKVAEGCSRRCAFCIIPRIRGRQRSRAADEVVAEARALAAGGVRELVLVAQDLTHWGADLPGRPGLATLVRRLDAEVPDARWIRLMYLFPRDLPDDLLDAVAESPRVLPYLDIPVQHADDRVLRAMRRGTTRRGLEADVARIRARVPGVALRTTFMVGFPGETDEAFEGLLDFARAARFEMAGVFRFSAEPGSHAATLPDPVPGRVARDRERRLQAVLSEVAASSRTAMRGRIHDAVVESPDGRRSVGRLWMQAPEVDGVVRIDGSRRMRARDLAPGRFVRVRITGAEGPDFLAEPAP